MKSTLARILTILLVVGIAIAIDFPILTQFKQSIFGREISPELGLDLKGGMRVLLESPEGYDINADTLQIASKILENRSNALGVSEVNFQVAGDDYIVGEFPGLEDIAEVIDVIKQTGLLEFVDLGDNYLPPETLIKTDINLNGSSSSKPGTSTTLKPLDIDKSEISTQTDSIETFHTVISGSDLDSVIVVPPQNPTEGFSVYFTLKQSAKEVFAEYTRNNIGSILAIVLDKEIISTPYIQQPIENGEGAISGQGENAFTYEEANNLRITLFYGTLPVSLEIAESRVIGPTLGEESLNKSMKAGVIGLTIVILFMLLYYRIPGLAAVFSILIFGLITFAIYLIIPVTLTLPGIAGFLLSIGSALDANILQFERLKEELRKGRSLVQAVDLGWSRAWPSIRDSNLATLITSGILFWFGSAFGATIVKGFALTLAIGVAISLFTALFVSRTLLNLFVIWFNNLDKEKWFGV